MRAGAELSSPRGGAGIAGRFGGVTGAVILAIVGDVIPDFRRGEAMGMVMSAFSVASIFGVPLGLFLATTLLACAVLCHGRFQRADFARGVRSCRPLRGHLDHARDEHPAARMLAVLMEPNHQMAFVFMAVLTFAGFAVFPPRHLHGV